MNPKERVEQLKEEVNRLSGGQAWMGGIDQVPPEVAVKFLERVIEVEKQDIEERRRNAN